MINKTINKVDLVFLLVENRKCLLVKINKIIHKIIKKIINKVKGLFKSQLVSALI